MRIAVASGKGGTGKTTIATSLARAINGSGSPVAFLDCDVEAPNAHLFLQPRFEQRLDVNILIPQVNEDVCKACGRCSEVCQFHAIVLLGGKILVFPELCHGCGSCKRNCPENAINEIPHALGIIERGLTPDGIHFSRGVLNIGKPMAIPIIHQLKKWQDFNSQATFILDAPPGVSCPVVETLRDVDFVVLVTEPTPFGLHDLQLAHQLTRDLNLPSGAIINRDGIGDTRVVDYCYEENLPILMRIPFSRKLAEGIAGGLTLIDIDPKFTNQFRNLISVIYFSSDLRKPIHETICNHQR